MSSGLNQQGKTPQKKISINLIFNLLSQFTYFIVPVLITPYVSRVLNAELIGEYSFTLANSNYFVLAETLGFTLYGQIRVAAVRDDKEKLSKLFWELFFIRLFLMTIFSIAYLAVIFTAESQSLQILYAIMIINIISSGVDITWLLNGLEEFKITALRSIIIKVCNLIFIYLFVREESDFYIYALIMQGFVLFGYISVYPILRKKIMWCGFKSLCFKQHFIPSVSYLIPGVVNTVFTSLDKTLLGSFIADTKEVGYYQQASSLITAFTTVISSISNVLLPRITYLHYNEKDEDTERRLMFLVFGIVLAIAVPITFGLVAISDIFIPIYLGDGYAKSALLVRILSINVILVSLSNSLGQLCLVAKGKQKQYNLAIILAAVVNMVLNLVLIHFFTSIGVSIASIGSNIILLICLVLWSRKSISFRKILMISWKFLLSSAVMFVCVIFFNMSQIGQIWNLILKIILGIAIYFVCLLILRDKTLLYVLKQLFKRGKKNDE